MHFLFLKLFIEDNDVIHFFFIVTAIFSIPLLLSACGNSLAFMEFVKVGMGLLNCRRLYMSLIVLLAVCSRFKGAPSNIKLGYVLLTVLPYSGSILIIAPA